MGKRPDEATIKLRLANIISDAEDKMFERFDQLHKQEIHDNDVVGYLRNEGHTALAERYIEWGMIVVDVEEDNTTTSPAVPDPGDAASYEALQKAMQGSAGVTFSKAPIYPLGKIEDKRVQSKVEVEWP